MRQDAAQASRPEADTATPVAERPVTGVADEPAEPVQVAAIRPAERSERSERSDRGERAPRGAGASPYSAGGRRDKVDPWFLKPYEPAKSAAPAPSATLGGASAKPKPKLAFLLGGAPK